LSRKIRNANAIGISAVYAAMADSFPTLRMAAIRTPSDEKISPVEMISTPGGSGQNPK
jgi:hypothetical protein